MYLHRPNLKRVNLKRVPLQDPPHKQLQLLASRRAHLINASVQEDASTFFTEEFPNFIQCAGSVDGASVCAKLVSMIHDQPLESEDPTIICQIDFANAFQTPNRQLGTNDCILGIALRTYDQGRVKGAALPHLKALKNFFPYFKSMNDVASRNRFTDNEGTTHSVYPRVPRRPPRRPPRDDKVLPHCTPDLGPCTRQTHENSRRGLRRWHIPHGKNTADIVGSR